MNPPRHPMQPLVVDYVGVIRFRENAIVRYLLDEGKFDLDHLASLPFSNEDREQFAQLIGYSVSGFWELPYVTGEAHEESEQLLAEFTAGGDAL